MSKISMLLLIPLISLYHLVVLLCGMGRPLVTACVLCLLCATHAHCAATHASGHEPQLSARSPLDAGGGLPNRPVGVIEDVARKKRSEEDFVREVFEEFGDGETMNKIGFQRLLHSLGLDGDSHKPLNSTASTISDGCGTVEGLIGRSEVVTRDSYRDLCPKLVHRLVKGQPCLLQRTQVVSDTSDPRFNDQTAVWVYATVSVIMISLCGLLAVAVIPLMHHNLYQSLLQFLVALAVGTLCGDALLHLLPHAMMSMHGEHEADHPPGGHGHDHSEEEDQHATNLWRGLVAAMAIVFFYFTEKCLSLVAEWRKKRQRKNTMNTRVRVMRDDGGKSDGAITSRVGEKLCKHKYSSYPYCYGEIASQTAVHCDSDGQNNHNTEAEINSINLKEENGAANPMITNNRHGDMETETGKEDVPSSEKQLLETSRDGTSSDYTTVILREHETRHHGHAHTHGHVHSAPRSLGSVAWMVVLGDGLHNFTDGLAIGAAFASNIGGGVSTAVAVFCHELPHELGDFAVLLKAGMSAKQAVFYNLLSSVLCLIGMCLGVILGHNESMTYWVFSAAAGMFLYIALVDMIPELTSSHSTEGGSVMQGVLQLTGLLTGISTMLLIALYEHDLKDAFKHSF